LLSQSFPNDFNPHLEKLKDKIKIKSTKWYDLSLLV
jgi:hypothetical protein